MMIDNRIKSGNVGITSQEIIYFIYEIEVLEGCNVFYSFILIAKSLVILLSLYSILFRTFSIFLFCKPDYLFFPQNMGCV